MLAAHYDGVLADGDATVECLRCRGTCSSGKIQCGLCEASGRLRVPPFAELAELDDFHELSDIIRCVNASRENPPDILRWLSYPPLYVSAYRLMARYIFGEFEDRRKATREAEDRPEG